MSATGAPACCGGSGLADYAAVPCPDPQCPVDAPDRAAHRATNTLDGHPWADQHVAVETGDRLITRAYRAAQASELLTVRRAMAALMDVALTLPPDACGGIFGPAHRAALAVVQAFLRAQADQEIGTGRFTTQLAAEDSDWTLAVAAYGDRAAEFSIKHVARTGGQAFSDEIGRAAADAVCTALLLTPRSTR